MSDARIILTDLINYINTNKIGLHMKNGYDFKRFQVRIIIKVPHNLLLSFKETYKFVA